LQSVLGNYAPWGKLVPMSHGYRMFLKCTIFAADRNWRTSAHNWIRSSIQQQNPEAVAQAVSDGINEVKSNLNQS
jgi:hypothetical protein